MLLDKLKETGLFRFRVNLGSHFELDDEEVYVVLGEPSMRDYESLQKAEGLGYAELSSLMERYILDHNVEKEEGKKASCKAVIDLFNSIPEIFMEVQSAWIDALPLVQKNREKLKTSAAPPSAAE